MNTGIPNGRVISTRSINSDADERVRSELQDAFDAAQSRHQQAAEENAAPQHSDPQLTAGVLQQLNAMKNISVQ